MNTVHSVMLAGQLNDVVDGWISMLQDWGEKALKAGVVALVFITMVQKLSLRAGIVALLLMIIVLGLYDSRNDLASMFTDEVKNPSKGAPAVPGIVQGSDPFARVHVDGAGGPL